LPVAVGAKVTEIVQLACGSNCVPQRSVSAKSPVTAMPEILSSELLRFASVTFFAAPVLPTRCRVSYDRRLLPGETHEGVLSAIQALRPANGAEFRAVIAEGEHKSYTGRVLRQQKFFPAWVFAEEHPFVQSALAGLRAAGLAPSIGAYRFCTNAAYSAGQAGVPTVGFGPAAEGDAHVVDERLELAALHKAAAGYRGIIEATLSSK